MKFNLLITLAFCPPAFADVRKALVAQVVGIRLVWREAVTIYKARISLYNQNNRQKGTRSFSSTVLKISSCYERWSDTRVQICLNVARYCMLNFFDHEKSMASLALATLDIWEPVNLR